MNPSMSFNLNFFCSTPSLEKPYI